MPDKRRSECNRCGVHRDVAGMLSWTGLCTSCGRVAMNENVEGIASRTGYAHRRRLRGIARYLEREALDGMARDA